MESFNSNYLDGILVTTNGFHVWSYAARCDCNNNVRPIFIKGDYTCGGSYAQLPYQKLFWESQ